MKFNHRNISISPSAKIGLNVRIGDNTVIYDNVEIGANSVISNSCVIGEPLNNYYENGNYQNPATRIGEASLIRSHAIIYAGCLIGKNLTTGHRIIIRENTIIGDSCLIGSMCDLEGELIIGSYCRLHSYVNISQGSVLGNYIFMYPFSVITNDLYPPSPNLKGSEIGNYTVIGVHSTILPNLKIGNNCFIGANSVVNKNLDDFTLAIGNPLKIIMDARKLVTIKEGRPYPWMYRFDRGMPWKEIGYDAWLKDGKE